MNYSQVQAAVQAYVHRDDPATVANIPNAVQFGQAWIEQFFEPQQANVIGTLVFVAGVAGPWAQAPLPADFGRFIAVSQPGAGALDYVTPRVFADAIAPGAPFIGGFYTIAGGLVLADGSLVGVSCTTVGIQQAAALVAGTDSNYLSASFADLLTWAAVAEQHRFLQDWDEGANAQAYAEALAKRYSAAHTAKQQSGGRLVIKG
jgi:hypothetical protein